MFASRSALDRFQQLQPVLQGRMLERIPLDVLAAPSRALEKPPVLADTLGVDMPFHPVFTGGRPTDLCFSAHGGQT
jgi:hypothetical protein